MFQAVLSWTEWTCCKAAGILWHHAIWLSSSSSIFLRPRSSNLLLSNAHLNLKLRLIGDMLNTICNQFSCYSKGRMPSRYLHPDDRHRAVDLSLCCPQDSQRGGYPLCLTTGWAFWEQVWTPAMFFLPFQCPAIDYTRHTLDGAACLLNSNKYFPSRYDDVCSIPIGPHTVHTAHLFEQSTLRPNIPLDSNDCNCLLILLSST